MKLSTQLHSSCRLHSKSTQSACVHHTQHQSRSPVFLPQVVDSTRCCSGSLETSPLQSARVRRHLAAGRVPVLTLLSACVETTDDTARFENLAGRSAMIGIAVAVVVELFTEESLFALSADEISLAGATALAVISTAAIMAATSKRVFSARLKEAVISSLTAVKRSASSVTQTQVDKAVDYLFERSSLSEVTGLFQDEFY